MARRQVSIFINGREVANQIKSITAEKRKVVRELNKMTVGSAEYNAKVKELNQLNSVIDRHRNNIRGVESTWSKVSKGVGKFAAVAGIAFGAEMIVDYGKKLFTLGSEMELLTRKAETVFGDALPQVTEAARQNANAMGLTVSQYTDASAAIGDLLIPMKFTREEAAAISTGLVDLSGALSEWTGGQRTAEEVTEILGKAMLGEREQLKSLGISIQEADVKARLAEKGLSDLTGEMLQQAKAAATLELITEKSTDAQAAFAENSDLSARKQAELTAQMTDATERLATALTPVFTGLLELALDFTRGLGGVAEGISAWINPAEAASTAFYDQVRAVETLDNKLVPLLDNYDALQSKTELSKDEQKELSEVIQEISEITPGAITEIDNYGRALGINAEAARELYQAQKDNIELTREIALEENALALEELTERQRELNSTIEKGTEFVADFFNLGSEQPLTDERYAKLRKDLRETTEEIIRLQTEQTKLSTTQAGDSPVEDKEAEESRKKAAKNAKLKARAKAEAQEKEEIRAREKREKEVKKGEERLQQIIEKFRQDQRLDRLTDNERILEEIRLQYEEQIKLAKELEAKGSKEATGQRVELERLQAIAIQEEKEKQAQKFFDEDMQRLSEEQEEEGALIAQGIQARAELEREVRRLLMDEGDVALLDLELYYADLIQRAEKAGIDTTEITRKLEKEKSRITKEQAEKRKKTLSDEQKAQIQSAQAYAKAFSGISNAISGAIDLVGDKTTEAAQLSKVLALANIGIQTAQAIATGVATAVAAGPFPANLAAIATTVGTVLSNVAAARKLLNENPIPQRKDGGYVNVRGAQDGIRYRARYIGEQNTGMLPSSPVVLASERGPEYFVSNQDLQNPVVANYVRMIDNISRNRGVTQFVDGGFNGDSSNIPSGNTAGTEATAMLIAVIDRLDARLASGIPAIIDDDTIVDINDKFRELNASSGNVLGLG